MLNKEECLNALDILCNYADGNPSSSGEFIGSNIKEAVIWFKNPDNASVVSALSNKLKNY